MLVAATERDRTERKMDIVDTKNEVENADVRVPRSNIKSDIAAVCDGFLHQDCIVPPKKRDESRRK